VKNSAQLDVVLSVNKFTTVIQVFKRFPLFSPIQFLFAPLTKLKSIFEIEEYIRVRVRQRIERRSNADHVDFFEYVMPSNGPPPTDKQEFTHLGSVAIQIMLAAFGPISDWFYGTLFFLLEEAECYKLLTEEIRNTFKSYDDINPRALTSLPYLHACLEESLRVLPNNNTGLPRISPGAVVDGQYVPKGVRFLLATACSLPTSKQHPWNNISSSSSLPPPHTYMKLQ
jgi:cytochrome P450